MSTVLNNDLSDILIQQVKEAIAQRQPIRIVGKNSKRSLASPGIAQSNHSILRLGEHCGVIHYDPTELVLTVRAGTPLSEIKNLLAEQGQMLSAEPPEFDGSATIGGTLAANLSGPSRPWAGSIRDHVLGVRMINGRGEHLQFGGQVMKNVAGFDVTRLQAGAMGTLGVMTEISIKVMPIPASTATVQIPIAAKEAILHMNQLAATPLPLTAACWQHGLLSYRFSGAISSVEKATKQILDTNRGSRLSTDAAALHWQEIGSQAENNHSEILWRFSVKSTAELPTATDEQWLVDWCGSQRWLKGDQDWNEMIQYATAMQGEVCRYSPDGTVEQMPIPAAVEKLRDRVKQAFDPETIFNPNQWQYPNLQSTADEAETL